MKSALICAVIVLLGSCSPRHKDSAQVSDSYYTCAMHPQIREDKPGKCPICGMTLIVVQKNQELIKDGIVLSDQQIQLGNIRIDTIGKGKIANTLVLNATLAIDETRSVSVSIRLSGRIDKLYFKNLGEFIKKGDRLYDLYSEELNNAKQEYILALEKEKILDRSIVDFKQLAESSRNKLMLWGMSNDQIALLGKTKQAASVTSFYSPVSGTITAFAIHEGEYITAGGTILRLADLSTLWAEAQVYTTQLSEVDPKGKALVRLPDLGKELSGHVEMVYPEINPDTRINLVRISIPNKDHLLKPGMIAYVELTNPQITGLTISANAVLKNERNNIVWIQTGHNTYKSVSVTLGKEDGDQVEIRSGLRAGDLVVVDGAYLINSEYIFQKGSTPVESYSRSTHHDE